MSDLSVREFFKWNRYDPAAGTRVILPSLCNGSVRQLFTTNFRISNCLTANQRLLIGDQLVSNNDRLNLIMQEDGNLVLYRKHFNWALWTSNTYQKPVNRAIMKADGDLAVASAQDVTYWHTNTPGHPGASVAVRDDGNLVVNDRMGNPIWTSNTIQDFFSPTFGYEDDNHYKYVEISEFWKQFCGVFPCFDLLHWPGYDTFCIQKEINNESVVIQLWKGWCQQFLGLSNFPGGVGAEVGVYRRISGKDRTIDYSRFPRELPIPIQSILSDPNIDIWWPYPELNAKLEFTLVKHNTDQALFNAGPETSYWLGKWMDQGSYNHYCHTTQHIPVEDETGYYIRLGDFSGNYDLKYKVTLPDNTIIIEDIWKNNLT